MAKEEFVFVSLYLLYAYSSVVSAQNVTSASCIIEKNSGIAPISGSIYLYQQPGNATVMLRVDLVGFNKTATATKHGFHVHQSGNLSNNCVAAGAHFNPENRTHGAPEDQERHVGDLGNVVVDVNGEVHVNISDTMISLSGSHSVLNRAIVVHETFDDLGRGNFSDSKTTGHAGARFGCCVITMVPVGSANRWPLQTTLHLVALAAVPLIISNR